MSNLNQEQFGDFDWHTQGSVGQLDAYPTVRAFRKKFKPSRMAAKERVQRSIPLNKVINVAQSMSRWTRADYN